ncbi:calcium-binding protein [Cereibacter azotoformans]|uniref:Hemolysin type calcium-binding protein n=1 Tax=Cereibacter azotoformans TaxID=43057 RepID=A0A2T5JR66_9RHOB|nr:M10 family metallopeptidase C-terminal domain-containing protein [Cereibacter azotoformans]PTR10450.1 hemolysin type calcium-binding protein [Cereibacter azotoformans]
MSLISGRSISYSSVTGHITGGTVTGYIEAVLSDGYYAATWGIERASVSAVSLYKAGLTRSTTDDMAIMRSLLGGNDRFDLSNMADLVRGHGGDDTILGRGGHDRLFGGAGQDRIDGGSGNDRLYGEAGQDRIDGGSGNDRLYGEAGHDRIDGGTGADLICGGAGRDLLLGGADRARDVFLFRSVADSRPGKDHDTIRNFIPGIDDIDLRPIDARPAAGDQAFTFSGGTARAWSVWCVDTGPDILVRADVTGDGRADFEILVANVDRLTASDFLL